jgi:hypothetical protein
MLLGILRGRTILKSCVALSDLDERAESDAGFPNQGTCKTLTVSVQSGPVMYQDFAHPIFL